MTMTTEAVTRPRLWYERHAKDITRGDFVMLQDERGAWTPRVVTHVVSDSDGKIIIGWWNENRVVTKTYEPEHLMEML